MLKSLVLACAGFCALGFSVVASAATYNVNDAMIANDAAATPQNPYSAGDGYTYRYGFTAGLGGGFSALTFYDRDFFSPSSGLNGWNVGHSTIPCVLINPSNSTINPGFTVDIGAHEILLHPNGTTQSATVRAVVPVTGTYNIVGNFRLGNGGGDTIDQVRTGGGDSASAGSANQLFSINLAQEPGTNPTVGNFSLSNVALTAGDHIDFIDFSAGGSASVLLSANISLAPEPSSLALLGVGAAAALRRRRAAR